MALAMGQPDPGEVSAPDVTETDADGGSDEQAEDDAIDAVFETKDPAARREAFRRAVSLCAKDYGG